MRNIFLIARREYMERVHTKAFIFSLIFFPAIMALVIAVPAYFSSHDAVSKNSIVVTSDAALGQALTSELAASQDAGGLHFTLMQPRPALRTQLNAQVEAKQIEGYLWLPDANASSANANLKLDYVASSAGDMNRVHHLQELLQRAEVRKQLTQRGISQSEIQSIFAPVHIDIVQLRNGKSSNALGTYATSLVLMFMLYGALMFQGVAVSQSVVEEKSSRIFEVMLSILTPQEMLAGKLLGIGAVGLTQVGIWLLAGLYLTGPGLASLHAAGGFSIHLAPWSLVAFIVCFLLGFVFYSALSAMLGSMVNSNQEAQQLSPFITMPLILSVVAFQVVLTDPSGSVATVLSMLPPFAPILMYLRIAVQTPPLWQIALSLGLMLGSVWFVLWFASRIYRVGILMYGKRPTLPELLRWLKYS